MCFTASVLVSKIGIKTEDFDPVAKAMATGFLGIFLAYFSTAAKISFFHYIYLSITL